MAQPKKNLLKSIDGSQLEIIGLEKWGDVAAVNSYDIMFADNKNQGFNSFGSVMKNAANDSVLLAPIDTGLLRSTIRGKYKIKNYGEIDFYILAGGTGFIKDYYNDAFQKTEWNSYMKPSKGKIKNNSKQLNIYPMIQEEKHGYLERAMESNIGNIDNAFLEAYERAIIEKSKKGK